MAISEHTPRIQQPMTRRAVIGTGIAATALAAVPVLAAPPEPADALDLAKYHATELARALNMMKAGNWEIHLVPEKGFVLIVDRAEKAEAEGPLLADDVTGTTDFADWDRLQQRRKAVRS